MYLKHARLPIPPLVRDGVNDTTRALGLTPDIAPLERAIRRTTRIYHPSQGGLQALPGHVDDRFQNHETLCRPGNLFVSLHSGSN